MVTPIDHSICVTEGYFVSTLFHVLLWTAHIVLCVIFLSGSAPKTVRLFINQTNTLDFDAAEQRKPIQEFRYDNSIVHVKKCTYCISAGAKFHGIAC